MSWTFYIYSKLELTEKNLIRSEAPDLALACLLAIVMKMYIYSIISYSIWVLETDLPAPRCKIGILSSDDVGVTADSRSTGDESESIEHLRTCNLLCYVWPLNCDSLLAHYCRPCDEVRRVNWTRGVILGLGAEARVSVIRVWIWWLHLVAESRVWEWWELSLKVW